MRADAKNDTAIIDILSGINPSNRNTHRYVLLYILPLLSMFVGVLSGIRLPNIWSVTLYLFDYNFGFSKRGLMGAILSSIFNTPISYWVLSGVAVFIFVTMLVMLWLLYVKLADIDQNIYLIQILFFTSLGFVFLCHEIGYYDHVGLIVAIACILLPVDTQSIILRVVLISIALLIHEAFLILFLPVVIFDTYIKSVSGGFSKSVFIPLAIAVIAVGIVVAISIIGKFDIDRREEFIAHLSAKAADFAIRRDAVQINFRGLTENFLVNYPLWANPGRIISMFFTIVVTAPVVVFLIANAIGIGERLLECKRRRINRYLLALAALSPFALNAIAWDLHRFTVLTQVTSYLVLASVVLAVGKPASAAPAIPMVGRRVIPLFCIILMFNLWSEVTLFNGYQVQKFPGILTQPLSIAREIFIDRTKTISDLIPTE